MSGEFKEWTEEVLPTKWSRRTAGLLLPAAGLAYGLPGYLPDAYLPSWPVETFLLRLVLMLSTLLCGSLAILALVVREFHDRERAHKAEKSAARAEANAKEREAQEEASNRAPSPAPKAVTPLDDFDKKLLLYLANGDELMYRMQEHMNALQSVLELHLYDLVKRGFISCTTNWEGVDYWNITPAGTRCLIETGALNH